MRNVTSRECASLPMQNSADLKYFANLKTDKECRIESFDVGLYFQKKNDFINKEFKCFFFLSSIIGIIYN
jgi:hypothetical protein